MNARVTALRAWWDGLARRERAMVAVMLVLVAAFVAWYGVRLPLLALETRTEAARTQALAHLEDVEALAAMLDALPTPLSGDAARAAATETLAAEGVLLSGEEVAGDELVLLLPPQPSGPLAAALDGLRTRGVRVAGFALRRETQGVAGELRIGLAP
ncbi:type II secretion system protein GspM [Coralloluteibacterium thermophilus]|uniref:Type II secretion system protein GspM n=1 Tax=Coralloluteibacterium thermophilum TaxID=2707049 RepID=A0ABV9NQD6_9GAMM